MTRIWKTITVLAGCAAMLSATGGRAVAETAESPTPGGPAAPAEAPVHGPVNVDTLTAAVAPDHGYLTGVTVEFDRTSRTNGDPGVLITIPATGAILENTLEPVTGELRGRYGVGLDELLPSPLPPHERGATTRFRVTFGAVHTDDTATHSYLESLALPGETLEFGLWSRFVTGQIAQPTASAQRPGPVL